MWRADAACAGPAVSRAEHNDAIIYDVGGNGKPRSGFDHPGCGHNEVQVAEQTGASADGPPPGK